MFDGYGPTSHTSCTIIKNMKTFIVKGMHCGACEKLITMELEEVGFDALVKEVQIDGEKKEGIFHLKDGVQDEEIEKMRVIINGMDGYFTE